MIEESKQRIKRRAKKLKYLEKKKLDIKNIN